ncbi:DUF192 domain-containing protein [Candidatus Methylacidithermus pantelleriae]|uniref:DUF192 domain-containing protein n=1 Tax=Candidatus Methylacidithermus pantelleriae TaxID=2744239 RepID=UPI001BD1CF28|nr:DUF192 domain-containing protein [Candidatus Methylacidithermus pantelleriae]
MGAAILVCLFSLPALCLAPATPRFLVLALGSYRLRVELAVTPEERSHGLQGRFSLDPDTGMLFLFPREGRVSFWMYRTVLPLSLAFLDATGSILEIRTMKPLDMHLVWSSSSRVRMALEVSQGWFQSHGIHEGDHVEPVGETWEECLARIGGSP